MNASFVWQLSFRYGLNPQRCWRMYFRTKSAVPLYTRLLMGKCGDAHCPTRIEYVPLWVKRLKFKRYVLFICPNVPVAFTSEGVDWKTTSCVKISTIANDVTGTSSLLMYTATFVASGKYPSW